MEKEKFDLHYKIGCEYLPNWISRFLNIEEICIIDFGANFGVKTLGYACCAKPKKILGVDINCHFKGLAELAKLYLNMKELPNNMEMKKVNPGQLSLDENLYDACYSFSVFEHVSKKFFLEAILSVKKSLKIGGYFFVQVNPLFFSPSGHHFRKGVIGPWQHLIESEKELKKQVFAHKGYKSHDAAQAEWNVYKTLNKITLGELKTVMNFSGFELVNETFSRASESPSINLCEKFGLDTLQITGIELVYRKK
jgi:hypothetical protein